MQEGAASPFLSLSTKAGCAGLCRQDTFPLRLGRGRGNAQGNLAAQGFRTRRACRRVRITFGGLRPSKPPQWGFFDGLRPAQTTFQRIDKLNTLLRGCRKGRQAPSYLIRSGGVYTARSGCKPLPLSCSARALCAQEHNVPFAARLRNSLAAKDRDFVTVFPGAAAYTLLYRNGRPTFSCRVLFKPRSPRVYYEWTPWRQARTRTQGESARKQEEAEG